MAFSATSNSGSSSEINVTPLIDVLLVLLIIFMVIVPTTPKGLEALVPRPPKEVAAEDGPSTIVVQVDKGTTLPVYKINDRQFDKADISRELTRIFETRQEKVMFVKGDKDLDVGSIAEVIGFGRAADVNNIGIITPQVEAGH